MDLADKVDDLICVYDESLSANEDVVAMLAFCIFVFAVLAATFCYHLFGKTGQENRGSASARASSEGKTADLKATTNSNPSKLFNQPTTISQSTAAGGASIRKRINSKSGRVGSVKREPTRITFPSAATGPDPDVARWTDAFLKRLYSDFSLVTECTNAWLKSLNEFTKNSVAEYGVGLEISRILPESNPPILGNVFCEAHSNASVVITCDCEASLAMQVKALGQNGEKVLVSNYRANVNRLRSRLSVVCHTEKRSVAFKLDGWPEVKITLARVGSLKNDGAEEEEWLRHSIVEILTSALRSAEVKLTLEAAFPEFEPQRQPRDQYSAGPYESTVGSKSASSKYCEKLIVKVTKADGLLRDRGKKSSVTCTVEVDYPLQSNRTAPSEDAIWNERFLFDVNRRTRDVMLEVYERGDDSGDEEKCLGVAIVSVDKISEETLVTEMALQARPYQNDQVAGTLTVEFARIEAIEEWKNSRQSSVPAATKIYSNGNNVQRNSRADCAEDKVSRARSNSRNVVQTSTTPIIRDSQVRTQLQHQNANEEFTSNPAKPVSVSNDNFNKIQNNNINEGTRARKTRRDFFGTFRRRLRSKGRSKSCEKTSENGSFNNNDRCASVDRDREAHSDHLSIGVAPARATREGSVRSSLSEMSGVSGASSRTYLNEASTLVLETFEDGIKRFYLVPLSMALKNRWKKKGTKLHIYNEHTFVARHLASGTICEVCLRALPLRLGKQGYECRDCRMKCHKRCHVRTEITCPTSTTIDLDLATLPILSE